MILLQKEFNKLTMHSYKSDILLYVILNWSWLVQYEVELLYKQDLRFHNNISRGGQFSSYLQYKQLSSMGYLPILTTVWTQTLGRTKQVYFNHEALKFVSQIGWSSGIFYAEHHKSILNKRNYPEFFISNLLHTKNKDMRRSAFWKFKK